MFLTWKQSQFFSMAKYRLWFSSFLLPVKWKPLVTFELWCWRRLLRVPWTAKRSNQSILKEINPEYSLEGLTEIKIGAEIEAPILWPPAAKSQLIGKDPDAGKN